MPTKTEREYYAAGYRDGIKAYASEEAVSYVESRELLGLTPTAPAYRSRKPKRKLSAWNKFVKANSKKPRFVLRSGKLNLKKMGVAFRKSPQGKKKRR